MDPKNKLVKYLDVDPLTKLSVDQIKSLYIASGLTVEEIAQTVLLEVAAVQKIVDMHRLTELRRAYIQEGLRNIRNVQLQQVEKLLDIENNFKKLRISQLEEELKEFVAYFDKHGDFNKRHPVTGDVLRDTDGLPMQIRIPSAAKELAQLRESVTTATGLSDILSKIEDLIHPPKRRDRIDDGTVVDAEFEELFTKKK